MMLRIVRFEMKKILSLPVLILLAASVSILVAAPVSRYASFSMMNGLPPEEFRKLTTEYAGPLNQALADRALADWRALPAQYSEGQTDEQRARRQALKELGDEYASASDMPQAPVEATWDAGQRLSAALENLRFPAQAHGYYEGWRELAEALNAEGAWLCAALIVFGLSGLFSVEAASGMASSVRTARHGRVGLAVAKLTAAGVWGLFCAALCTLLPLIMSAALFGMQGGELPAQYVAKLAYPLTLAGYGALRIAMFFLGALALAAVTAALSALLPSVTAPAVAGMAVFLAPTIYAMLRLSSPALDSVMRYLPSRLLLPDEVLGKLQAVMLWQAPLWQAQWLGLVWAGLIPLLGLLASSAYLRTVREEPIIQE